MKSTADLFNLVQSLTKNEKRYVNIFLSSGFYSNNKRSLDLFRAISRQTRFDDAALKKQMGKSVAARFSAEKNKLFDLILESMLFLYRDSTPERRIYRSRLRAGVLFYKGFNQGGWKYFHKTRQMAEKAELSPFLALLAYQENQLNRVASIEDTFFDREKFQARDERIIRMLSEDLVLHTLFTEMLCIQKQFGSQAKNIQAALDRIIMHPLVDPSRQLVSFSATMCRLEIRAVYYSTNDNHAESYSCLKQITEMLESNPEYIDQNYLRYLNALSNQLMHAVGMRNYDVVPSLVKKTIKVNEGVLRYFSFDVQMNKFIGIDLYELISFRDRGDTSSGIALLNRLENDFIRYRSQLRDNLIVGILFLFGTYHFYLGNLKKALHHLNDLVNSSNVETGQNFQCMSRLVKLLLHYDMGHYELMPSLVQSTARLLKKKKLSGVFETELLNFCRQSNEGKNKTAFAKLVSVIRKEAPGYYSYGAWAGFDFEAWADAHLKDKWPAELVAAREKKSTRKAVRKK